MKNVPAACITETSDSVIKFEENKRVIRFNNPKHLSYKKVQVDGCALKEGDRCDNLLCSHDEFEERFVELKGTDVSHALDQLRASIMKIGQFNGNRHAYIISTNVAPQIRTDIQRAKAEFQKKFNSDIIIKERKLDVDLY